MAMKTRSKTKSYSVAALLAFVIIVLLMLLALLSSIFIPSLSFSQGALQQTWKPSKIVKTTTQKITPATITCDRSNTNYDLCSINSSCNVDSRTGTLTFMDSTSTPIIEKIRPYPRKTDHLVMPRITELTLTSIPTSQTRSCDITHNLPAIVYSAGGYTGSIYHDFNDGFIPLYITASSIYPDRDFILVVVDPKEWWMPKYIDVLGAFSKHKPILPNKENAFVTHCFTSATVGLISHGPMTINPAQMPNSESLVDFHNLLDRVFNTNLSTLKIHKPRLILVSRYGNIGRVILNEEEIKNMLEDVGFEVIIFRPSKKTSVKEAYKLMKSSHVMVGVHGAALTHLLFLRPGSVFVQVVPLGLGWAAETCYGAPAKAMKIEYIEYTMNVEESSLIEKYSRDDLVLKDPIAFRGIGWNVTKMKVYLKEQDVRLDMVRFRNYMNKAYEKAKLIMDING